MTTGKKSMPKAMTLFFVLMAMVAIGNGFSDTIYSNYFKDAYNMDAFWRGVTEWPRESPGMLCAIVIAGLGFLGDIRISLIAQVLAFLGLVVLGLTSPLLGVMYIFLFINSLGMHLFVPLQDAIGMSLAEPDKVGKRMGQYASLRSVVGFVCAIAVFFGTRAGMFSFTTQIKPIFLIGALGFLGAIIAAFALLKEFPGKNQEMESRKPKLLFRKQYRYFYLLTVLNGVQKQIAYVFGGWVLIDLLGQKADTMMILYIAMNLLGIFFLRLLGHWMDRFGIKRMMYMNALLFVFVYLVYGFSVYGIGRWYSNSVAVVIISILFVLDRMSMQSGIIRSVYLRNIALSGNDVTATLSTGISLDHVVSMVVAPISGLIWNSWGPQYVFFMAAIVSLGNVYAAWKVKPEQEAAEAERYRNEMAMQ